MMDPLALERLISRIRDRDLLERQRLQDIAAGRNVCAIADWFCAHRLNTSQTASLIWIDTGIQLLAMEAM